MIRVLRSIDSQNQVDRERRKHLAVGYDSQSVLVKAASFGWQGFDDDLVAFGSLDFLYARCEVACFAFYPHYFHRTAASGD